MPPKPKTEVQREADKQEIISAALDIIMEFGLEGLTMRKLGTKLQMSGANIYNYFLNKDELYIHILISGFEILNERLRVALAERDDPLEKVEKMTRAYVQFGLDFPSYYDLMFCTRDPKSLDYVGSSVEQLANHEKDVSMISFRLLKDLIAECLNNGSEQEAFDGTVRIICELHGCINMYQTNILKEMGADVRELTGDVIAHIIMELKNRQ